MIPLTLQDTHDHGNHAVGISGFDSGNHSGNLDILACIPAGRGRCKVFLGVSLANLISTLAGYPLAWIIGKGGNFQ